MLEVLSSAFSILLLVIDPLGVLPVFVDLTRHKSAQRRQQIALKATLISSAILVSFGFIGEVLLASLHISEAAFRIAGGILLMIIALDMVLARHSGITSTTEDEVEEARNHPDISVFPLAIPLIAGPGALMTMTMLMRPHAGDFITQAGIILMLLVVLFINYLCLKVSDIIIRWIGLTGANAGVRIFGIILAALAVQYIVDGLVDVYTHRL